MLARRGLVAGWARSGAGRRRGDGGDAGGLLAERLADLVATEAAGQWAGLRPERGDPNQKRNEARQWRTSMRLRGWSGGLPRLRYGLNPLLPCSSPMLAAHLVTRLQDLLPALEAVGARPEARRDRPVDREIVAFIAARHDQRLEGELEGLAGVATSEQAALVQLRVLAGLQRRMESGPLPALAAWLAEQAAPALAGWHNRARREALEHALDVAARSGQLLPMAALLENASARAADAQGFQAAGEAVRRINSALTALAGGADERSATARRIGHEAALSVAMMAMTVAVVAAALS